MFVKFEKLNSASRLLIEAELRPQQGARFQPTGFPDLGAAEYRLPDKTPMLIVESHQSVANRLEATLWDEKHQNVVALFQGIPYVEVRSADGEFLTNSLLEAHRLNSNYILESEDKSFYEQLLKDLKVAPGKPLSFQRFAQVLAKYDLNCLLHGVFLAKKEIAGGRYKLPRALSGFIEAKGVERVLLGGVKKDLIDPQAEAKEGGGHIPYHRTEYVAERITAYFNLDLLQIRDYALAEPLPDLLIAMALWKIHRFLERGLRLRTACDLELVELRVTQPAGWSLPTLQELEKMVPALIEQAKPYFADPPVTVVTYVPKKTKLEKDQKQQEQLELQEA
ncbi:MAG: type I-U CRISPR-associated RAMP protein Csb1/Cas7u [Gloeomargarita sp. SKYBB_i_bin120]|nr:type I-U CRISPR-associated RAMP protein Csb1/Cas7u [Gloeomargarita sp. SKYB120]MDW8178859.1 type I-U CRISPR-associated RAMP protein Csb1/Cas7u [Gloeomargarita sp. SKYBB_i_bin120]